MVFRKESKVDAFQRQISALRQQLGADGEQVADDHFVEEPRDARPSAEPFSDPSFGTREAAGYSFSSVGTTDSDVAYVDEAPPLPAIPTPAVDPQTSVVAHDTTWNGDLQTSGSLHLHGKVEGALTAQQDVYIAEEADVSATITAANVIVAGLVRGTIRCSVRFEVLPRGRIAGDVLAPTMIVHEGASINGQIRMGAGEPPASSADQPAPPVVHRRAARGGA